MEIEKKIEDYLSKTYWVLDMLPKQVPANGRGQYFQIEKYFRQSYHNDILVRKFLVILLKLNCYDDIVVYHPLHGTAKNPAPEMLEEWVHDTMAENSYIDVIFESFDTMMTLNGGDTYMTIYHPSPDFLKLADALAASEGLFVWKPPQQDNE